MSNLVNEMRVYPIEFFRQAPANVSSRVSMMPCKFNSGGITFNDRIDYSWNGAFSDNLNYWTITGGTARSVAAPVGGSFGKAAAQILLTSSQAVFTNDTITLAVATPMHASVYVSSPVAVKVAIQILGTESNGTTINDTATSGFITLEPNVTQRITVVSNYTATLFRRLRMVVGDGVTSEAGKEVYFTQAQMVTGTRSSIDQPDELSSDAINPTQRNLTAINHDGTTATLTVNTTSGMGQGETILITGLTSTLAIFNGVHRVQTVPNATTLTIRKPWPTALGNNTGIVNAFLWQDLSPGSPKGQLTHNLTLGAGAASNIEMDTPISGTFYTTVGTGGETGAGTSTIFAMSGTGGTVSLEYAKNTQTLTFSTPGGNITAAPASPPTATVISSQLSSNTATLTTASAHNFVAGGNVTITGLSAVYNGTYQILDTPSSTTFRYTKTNVDVALATGLNGTATFSGISLIPGDLLWFGFTIDKSNIIFKFNVNGGSISTAQTGSNTAPTLTFSRLHIGHNATVDQHWEGPIEQFLLYDVPISASELDTMCNKSTPTNMVDDSRIAFATLTSDQDNQYFMSYQRAKDLTFRWNGTWRNADIRARITNNNTNTGRAFNTIDLVSIQRDTDWFRSGGTSSWPQTAVWATAFVQSPTSTSFYYSPFYCTNPDYPDWSLWEVYETVDLPGFKVTQIVNPRWTAGSDERDFYYLSELTNLRSYPNDQRSYGYVQ